MDPWQYVRLLKDGIYNQLKNRSAKFDRIIVLQKYQIVGNIFMQIVYISNQILGCYLN